MIFMHVDDSLSSFNAILNLWTKSFLDSALLPLSNEMLETYHSEPIDLQNTSLCKTLEASQLN